VEVRRLANPVTFCDGHEVFLVAASGQIRMAANTLLARRLTALAFGYMLAATWVFAVSAPAGSIDRYWGDARAH
jgi:hypothetical protein